MEPVEYRHMAALEDSMWWYGGLHARLKFLLEKFLPDSTEKILDAGCGTGGFLRRIVPRWPNRRWFGADYYLPACGAAREKSRRPIVCGSLTALPFRQESFQGAVCADVLGQRSLTPDTAIENLSRVLQKKSCLILQLPAYQWLLSYHDRHVHNARRFSRGQAVALLEKQRFSVIYSSYWCCLPFPLLLAKRLFLRGSSQKSDVQKYSPVVNFILTCLLRWEEWLMRLGLRLPFGSSILVVGIKDD
jgi:SAM-dependent methyltransferase